MVRGVPVVGSDVAAVPEMLGEGCGLLVPADDAQALAAALAQLLDDEDLRASLSDRARERASVRFTLSGEVARLKELILDEP
jgi:glycosyltransferase involved in cell wall biosynthesis